MGKKKEQRKSSLNLQFKPKICTLSLRHTQIRPKPSMGFTKLNKNENENKEIKIDQPVIRRIICIFHSHKQRKLNHQQPYTLKHIH